MADTFENVVHLVDSVRLADLLRDFGADRIVVFPDRLVTGPVSLKSKKHRKRRLKYWRGLLGADSERYARLDDAPLSQEQLGSRIRHEAGGDRVLIWASPTFRDRLFLWFAFGALLGANVQVEQIATAEPLQRHPDDPERWLASEDAAPGSVEEAFEERIYPEPIYVETGESLWETFATGSPRQVALTIPHTEKFFPGFPDFAVDFGRFFPTVFPDEPERLFLSDFDEVLLAQFEPERVLEVDWGMFPPFVDILDVDVINDRLDAWLTHAPDDPILERAADDSGYLLTTRGVELVEGGTTTPRFAPVLHMCNARMYAGKTPWVRMTDGDVWWFERWQGGT